MINIVYTSKIKKQKMRTCCPKMASILYPTFTKALDISSFIFWLLKHRLINELSYSSATFQHENPVFLFSLTVDFYGSIFNCVIFIEDFRELSKHTAYIEFTVRS